MTKLRLKVKELETAVNSVTVENGILKNRLEEVDEDRTWLRRKVVELEDRSRRHNLRLVGFPEGVEQDNPSEFIQKCRTDMDQYLQQLELPQLPTQDREMLDCPILLEELQATLPFLKIRTISQVPELQQSAGKSLYFMDLVLWSLLLSTIGAASAINAAIGGTAFLSGQSPVSPNQQVDWIVDVRGTVIATRLPGANSMYAGRCIGGRCILHDNGTLQMEQLLVTDNGTYTMKLQAGVVVITEKVQLNVYNLLVAPLLLVSSTIRPVNGSNLSLKCNAGAQTVHSIYFYRDEKLLSCSELHLSCSRFEPNLYFRPILASDSGSYTCGIENPVSSNRSTAVYVDVAVYVSEVTLRSNVTHPVVAEKEAISLICSSYGTEVTYSWMLNDLPLPDNPRYKLINSNSTLVISPVSRSDEGTFTCRVSNYLNSETSGPFNLSCECTYRNH
ncbi:pregnancy-specific beta-1-glycoprotein 9-like [Bufo bufo]|uniref:pregnancy-specific beta-1-glycoprotein 9-like n=1 Tax=Bufo bufo TaxID=8384 RepID=UPI001ABE9E21|nr:pregnancy-specific beta-1-glycoprotein 9-like [Bufo bufo]